MQLAASIFVAVGISMAMIHADVFIPSVIIGVVCFLVSAVGLFAGAKLGEKFCESYRKKLLA